MDAETMEALRDLVGDEHGIPPSQRHRLTGSTVGQAELDRLEANDVADTARRIREGAAPGGIPAAISKAKSAVEMQKRTVAALGLAAQAA